MTGHDRDAITRVIKEAAPALRTGEDRDSDSYARRVVDFAFGVLESRLAHHLARQLHLLPVEDRFLEGQMAARGRGRAPLGR